jgi:hypothetical protein
MMNRAAICLLSACVFTTALLGPAAADSGAQSARRLVGTWTIRNETTDANYAGSKASGQVTFSADDTMTIDGGGLAAAGLVNGSEPAICLLPQAPISIKVFGTGANHVLYVSWTGLPRRTGGALVPQSAVIDIVKLNRNEAILIGQGGCGAVGTPRISHLTRVQ